MKNAIMVAADVFHSCGCKAKPLAGEKENKIVVVVVVGTVCRHHHHIKATLTLTHTQAPEHTNTPNCTVYLLAFLPQIDFNFISMPRSLTQHAHTRCIKSIACILTPMMFSIDRI